MTDDIREPKEDSIDDETKQEPGVHPELATGNDDGDDADDDGAEGEETPE